MSSVAVEDKKKNLINDIDYDSIKGRGAAFMVTPLDKGTVFSREQFSEEHNMFKQAAQEFAQDRIKPVSEQLNTLNKDLSIEIFREMGELGFLGIDVAEEFNGIDLDKTTACIVADALSSGENASIMVTMSAHTGIGMLPLVWYANKEQKAKYLSKLASGEYMGCYALTEPNAGSDALAGEATAVLNEEGTHYIINGQKIFVTNGSWADVCVTFASVDGKYTSFIIDKDCDGWVVGAEEKKMGIKGSSTCTYYFEDCKVPIENVLGKVGMGGPIAFNVLYVGRYKLGVTTGAGCRYSLNNALTYANERKQFSRSISEFGMVQNKFARMMVKGWESDTVMFATSGSIDSKIELLDKSDADYYKKVQQTIEDHGIEASICKIVGSESLAYCVDEAVQVLGGSGFIEEYQAAGMYRDERINRIFEGTNEINRLLISGLTLKKAIMEEIPLRNAIAERMVNWLPKLNIETDLPDEAQALEYMRSSFLFVLNELILKYGQDLKNEQWVLEPLANIIISLSIADMGLKRYLAIDDVKIKSKTKDVVAFSVSEQFEIIVRTSMQIISHIFTGNELEEKLGLMCGWKNKLNYTPDTIGLKRKIAEDVLRIGKYYLD